MPITAYGPTAGALDASAPHWIRVRAFDSFEPGRAILTQIYKGPYSELSAAVAYLRSVSYESSASPTIRPQASPDSSVATITFEQFISTGWLPKAHEVRPPSWEIHPVRQEAPLRKVFMTPTADHGFGADPLLIMEIDTAIAGGGSVVGLPALEDDYQTLRLQGVDSFAFTSYNLRACSFFDYEWNRPDLSAEYALANNAMSWADCNAPAYLTEPKINAPGETGSGLALSWLYLGPQPQFNGRHAVVCREWLGALSWSQRLYGGGTGTP